MRKTNLGFRSGGVPRAAARLLQATVLALALALAMPSRAADERPVKSRCAPVYPEIAKRMRITGVVKVEATVGPEGNVTDVKTLSGNRTLSVAAEDAVRKWKFAPAPETTTVDIEINFALGQ